ncbi:MULTISPECIES: ribbon-helix-helix protein, CopG family [Sphingomonadales]|uniref:ribbon-helix-helix protein, CopG family n=1 Tax=Sphingomonadales TaxID=204457 RepID=UPI0006AD1261|nr:MULTISPECIES: ribbon-helix-helix protein, CopG family [Sphingomonadales]ALC14700.1 hypothetical protein LH20_22290 [Sphingopyxis sp. 113P3]MBU0556452.1 ribbon-helix-helix domain-containing protein [Alphaproteobacteria bacterium]MBU1770631.1 ribbon-helix-helix domain-containing protein [Alphaproteobacteria bacterium]
MIDKSKVISLRLTEQETAALDSAARSLGTTRAEVIRTALRIGVPFAVASHGINAPRLVMCLERMQAALDVIVHREHADAAPQLNTIAEQRMAEFHA